MEKPAPVSGTVEIKPSAINRDNGKVNERLEELNKAVTEGYSGVLNYIANYCDKEYCNSHNLIRMVRESNGETFRLYGNYNIKLGY
jgi:benzoyl-CoA reductase/2-hydroxyglutaryl-CoA dehydratase subunit BcrC/BadD/HgdB